MDNYRIQVCSLANVRLEETSVPYVGYWGGCAIPTLGRVSDLLWEEQIAYGKLSHFFFFFFLVAVSERRCPLAFLTRIAIVFVHRSFFSVRPLQDSKELTAKPYKEAARDPQRNQNDPQKAFTYDNLPTTPFLSTAAIFTTTSFKSIINKQAHHDREGHFCCWMLLVRKRERGG